MVTVEVEEAAWSGVSEGVSELARSRPRIGASQMPTKNRALSMMLWRAIVKVEAQRGRESEKIECVL